MCRKIENDLQNLKILKSSQLNFLDFIEFVLANSNTSVLLENFRILSYDNTDYVI